MREVERKLRVGPAEQERITDFCEREGFAALGETAQTDCYLTLPNRNIYQEDMALRLRTERLRDREHTILTFKGKGRDASFHDRTEIETGVEDGEALAGILRSLDFREVLTVRKKRKSYAKGPVTVSLDEVEGLGCFVEVEYAAADTEAGKEEAVTVIDGLIGRMGIESAVNEPKNYLQLLVAKEGSGGHI
ncbi:MAG: class IV adenylate cyclase [Clostridiales Family XIII bacterium]|jgi:adenylate cyclase class 2|nr:class IV adenylate cyclase [Clostridiales Family XIII bacterium]